MDNLDCFLQTEYVSTLFLHNENRFDDLLKDLEETSDTTNIDPDEFRKAASNLYTMLAYMELDIFSKALSKKELQMRQVKANLERKAERLTQDIYLIDKFDGKLDTVYSTIKASTLNYKANLKLFKANPCLETFKAVDKVVDNFEWEVSEFDRNYRKVALDHVSGRSFERVMTIARAASLFKPLPLKFVQAIEKEKLVDPYLVDIATELYDAIEEFLDKTVHLLDKEDGLSTIKNESDKIEDKVPHIKKLLYDKYEYLKHTLPYLEH